MWDELCSIELHLVQRKKNRAVPGFLVACRLLVRARRRQALFNKRESEASQNDKCEHSD